MLVATLLLSACAGFKPIERPVITQYTINETPKGIGHKTKSNLVLLVNTTQASPAYNTDQMVYVPSPYKLNYFAQNRWAETPAQMLHPLIVKTLQNTHHFRAIISPPDSGNYNLALNTQLLQLQQDFIQKPSQIHLVLRAQLTSADNTVVATKEFSVTITAPQDNPYGGVVAANQATAKMLADLRAFCLKAVAK